MAFACQRDSYLKEFVSKVVSCSPAQLKTVNSGKKETLEAYKVILEDTILFPEGGGQPDDHGYLNDVPVMRITRHGQKAIHFVLEPLEPGTQVKQKVNWERRFDHMQQHSGQHLVTAIADQEFGYKTTSWWLGEQVSFIELDTPSMQEEQLQVVEDIVNEKIRAAIPVTVRVYEEGDEELKNVHTRGLPEDYHGPVRIVTIEGVEGNMCCGTHVSNLSHLQVVKLLHTEKGKKNKTNLYFLCGGRVLRYLGDCLLREKQLTTLLKNNPQSHFDLVQKLQKSFRTSEKNLQSVLKELAVLEAEKIKASSPKPFYFSLHRTEADSDFMSIFINEVSDENVLLFLTVGDEKGAGQMVLNGKPELVKDLGPRICEILGGKGAARGSKFQAKVTNLSNRSKADDLIKTTLG